MVEGQFTGIYHCSRDCPSGSPDLNPLELPIMEYFKGKGFLLNPVEISIRLKMRFGQIGGLNSVRCDGVVARSFGGAVNAKGGHILICMRSFFYLPS